MPNPYYTHATFPVTGSAATSQSMRAELDLITAGFDKLPTLAGNAGKLVVVNGTATGLTASNSIQFLDFNTAGGAGAVARLIWNDTDGTLDLGLKGGNVTLQLGQETVLRCLNNTGSPMTDLQAVYVNSSSGQRPTIALARADTEVTSTKVLGVVTEPIANNQEGFVTTDGLVRQVNTLGLTEGAVVWLSPSISGGLTTTKPAAPNHAVMIGYCVRTHGTQGILYVKVQNGYELDELHDVSITAPAAYNMFRRNAANTLWENIAGPTGAVVGTTDSQTLTNKTISGSNNTLSNIGNASLTNSSITINGSNVALGGSITVTATATNALTIGTGLSGVSYNGSAPVTIAIDSTVATLTGSQTLTNKTINLANNTLVATSAQIAAAVTDETGSGALVFATSPTLVTPNLGTPSAVTLTNATGLPVSTGISGLGANVASFLATPSSANLAAAVTDETGTGALVFGTNPVLTTPNLGTPSAVTLTNATGLPVSTGISGLGAGVATFLATPSSANLRSAVTDETGSGALVFATSPTLTTPNIGAATASQINITGQGDLRLEDTTGGEYVALQAPATLASSYTLTLPADDGTNGQALITDGSGNLSWSTAASGDVYGPASATDNAVARFDGTTGKLIQNSAVTIGDDGATVIAANSSSDALRITQTGSGNALVVEDSANPDATPFVINSGGTVIVGNTTSVGTVNTAQVQSITTAGNAYSAMRFSSGSGAPEFNFSKSKSDTVGTNASVANNDTLGILSFVGADGTSYLRGAWILGEVDGTPGTNDMPGRLVFSTTADGASSPTERMRIDSYGSVGIGGAAGAAYTMYLLKNPTGATTTFGLRNGGTIQSDVTSQHNVFYSRPATAASAFTVSGLYHYRATQGTFGAGSAVTAQHGFVVDSDLTGATTNYGFLSNIASGTGRWNFYASGTADNYFAGAVGIGSVPVTGSVLYIGANSTGATTTSGVRFNQTVLSDVTGSFRGVQTGFNTQGNAFTLSNLIHMYATQGTFNSPSVVTNQYGYFAESTLTGATNNYGFYSAISSGTGRYNFYAAGSADNYFAGNVGIGVLASSSSKFLIASNRAVQTYTASFDTYNGAAFENAFVLGFNGSVQSLGNYQNFPLAFLTNNTERMRIDSSGNVGIGGAVSGANALEILKTATGATSTVGFFANQSIQSDSTNKYTAFTTNVSSANSNFTISSIRHFESGQATLSNVSAGGSVTNQYGFLAGASLTGATNNYGFYSNIASGTGRYNFYAAGSATNYFAGAINCAANIQGDRLLVNSTDANIELKVSGVRKSYLRDFGSGLYIVEEEAQPLIFSTSATERMRIDSVGRVGIGATPEVNSLLTVFGNMPSGQTTGSAQIVETTIGSSYTGRVNYYRSYLNTAAAAFTVSEASHYYASQGGLGAGSAITSQHGFMAESNLTGATNNYGFYSNIASGTGRYNFYAAGSAQNYFAGNVGIGTTNPVVALHLAGTGGARQRFQNLGVRQWSIGNDASDFTFYDEAATAERMRITSTGNIYGTSGTTGMTDGFFYIPSAAGAPSGTPTAVAGHVPMYYDTTNNKFYIYNGAWKSVTLA